MDVTATSEEEEKEEEETGSTMNGLDCFPLEMAESRRPAERVRPKWLWVRTHAARGDGAYPRDS